MDFASKITHFIMNSNMKCRICGTTNNHPFFTAKEMMFGSKENFQYFLCTNCGCLQISQIPAELPRYYPANYYSYQSPSTITDEFPLYAWLQKQRCRTAIFGRGVKFNRLISRFVQLPDSWFINGPLLKKAKFENFNDGILDVGCGEHSSWLKNARNFGFNNLVGLDPFIKQNKIEFGINYFKENINNLKGIFRYITFHHSLEHAPDQLAQLCAVRRLLADGGICLVRIPLVSSYAWERYGVNWVELDAPRHLYLHSNKSIMLLAKKAGLRLVDTVYDSSEFEFAASEQYVAGIPLFDPRSYLVNPHKSIFTEREMDVFRQEAARVNAEGIGGRAGFFLTVDK